MKELAIGFVASVVIQFIGAMLLVLMFSGCAAEARSHHVGSYKPRVSHSAPHVAHVRVGR